MKPTPHPTPPPERETPEVEAVAFIAGGSHPLREVVLADFARNLCRQRDELREALKASERLRTCHYIDWGGAGGPDECKHGYAKGISCPHCDEATVTAALATQPTPDHAHE